MLQMKKCVAFIVLASLVAGCGGPWSWSGSGVVGPEKVESFLLKPPVRSEEQRYKLYLKSSDKVNVYVVPAKDEQQALKTLREEGKVECTTLAQPSHQTSEMVLGVLQVAPTENFAVLIVNPGKQQVSLSMTAQER
jgi:hypothetical protein